VARLERLYACAFAPLRQFLEMFEKVNFAETFFAIGVATSSHWIGF
jgi:hypothetical protein